MHSGLFVAHQHMAQAGLAVQGVIQGQHRATRVPEHRVHAEIEQRADQQRGARDRGGCRGLVDEQVERVKGGVKGGHRAGFVSDWRLLILPALVVKSVL
ncbi:hypothetical protein D9M69_674160 [compost metagenome]